MGVVGRRCGDKSRCDVVVGSGGVAGRGAVGEGVVVVFRREGGEGEERDEEEAEEEWFCCCCCGFVGEE